MNSKKRILVADDEQEIVKSLQKSLTKYYNVDVAFSASEILDKIDEVESFDAVLLDVDFPYGVSGIEIAEIIREDNHKIIIIIMSAIEYSQEIRQKVVDLGASFLEKTIIIDDVINIIGV